MKKVTVNYECVRYDIPLCMIRGTSYREDTKTLAICIMGKKHSQKLCFELYGEYSEKKADAFFELIMHGCVDYIEAADMYFEVKQERWIKE